MTGYRSESYQFYTQCGATDRSFRSFPHSFYSLFTFSSWQMPEALLTEISPVCREYFPDIAKAVEKVRHEQDLHIDCEMQK